MKKYIAVFAALLVLFAVRGGNEQKEPPKMMAKSNIVAEVPKPEPDMVPPVVLPKEELPKPKEPQVKKSGPVYSLGYVGNKKTRKFHHVGCGSVSKMKAANRVSLNSRGDAISRGYSPCSRCNP